MSDVVRMPVAGVQKCKDGCGCSRSNCVHLILADHDDDIVFEHSFEPQDARDFAMAMIKAADELEARAMRQAGRLS